MSLLGIVFAILVVCVVVWAVRALTAAFNVGEPLSTVCLVAVVLIAIVFMAHALGVGSIGQLRI